jgi:hypothetical protein
MEAFFLRFRIEKKKIYKLFRLGMKIPGVWKYRIFFL